MTEDLEYAMRVQRLADVIMDAIGKDDHRNDPSIVLQALSIVLGCYARATGKGQEVIKLAVLAMTEVLEADLPGTD